MKTFTALSIVAASFLTAVHAACERHDSHVSATHAPGFTIAATTPAKPAKSAPSAGTPAAPQPKPTKDNPGRNRPALPAHLFM